MQHENPTTRPRSLRNQRALLWKVIGVVYLPVLLLLVVTGVRASAKQIPIHHIMGDAAAVAEMPFYTGALSALGQFFWAAAASVCLLTAAVLRTTAAAPDARRFLAAAGLLSVVLLLDDAFQFHETVARMYLGLPADGIFATYGVLTAALFVYYRRVIYQSDYALLLLAMAFLAASMGFDVLHDHDVLARVGIESEGVQFFLEDGCKLLGVAGWLSYFARLCYTCFTQRTGAAVGAA